MSPITYKLEWVLHAATGEKQRDVISNNREELEMMLDNLKKLWPGTVSKIRFTRIELLEQVR